MNAKPIDLYRHFDAAGRLLYVGISLNAISRLSAHKRDSGWSGLVASMTVAKYASRAEALEAEAIAIRDEKPIHNVMGKGKGIRAYESAPVPDLARGDAALAAYIKRRGLKLPKGMEQYA